MSGLRAFRQNARKLLQFEGQTKEKLGTPEARTVVDGIVM